MSETRHLYSASDILRIAEDYKHDHLYSDVNMGVHFGCDCGCGGDNYSTEEWNSMCDIADDAEKAFKDLCDELDIEWDL